eukprot:3364604-Prymnesium_polylepis.1
MKRDGLSRKAEQREHVTCLESSFWQRRRARARFERIAANKSNEPLPSTSIWSFASSACPPLAPPLSSVVLAFTGAAGCGARRILRAFFCPVPVLLSRRNCSSISLRSRSACSFAACGPRGRTRSRAKVSEAIREIATEAAHTPAPLPPLPLPSQLQRR